MIPLLQQAAAGPLTASEQLLLDYICEQPERFLHQTLQDICARLYISNATIVRFCQKQGFRGFHEFKFALREQLDKHGGEKEDEALFEQNLAVFKDALHGADITRLEKLYQMIHSHTTLYIYGSAMSSIPAHYLYSVLSSLDYACIFVDWRHLLQGIVQYPAKDALFILMLSHGSVERYGEILRMLHDNQSDVVVICDEQSDLLSSYATIFLNASERSVLVNNVDFSFKLNTLILIQLLIDMIYTRTDHRQQ